MALYAFDGTWNDSRAPDEERDPKKDTNVQRFRVLYEKKAEYVDGVGSRGGMIGKIIGGVSGAGARQRIDEQFEALKKNFAIGDTDIDIVGYSRGAAIARMFVLRINSDFDSLNTDKEKALKNPPPVRFLGLFDTVASFGIPWNANEHGFVTDIPEFVENTFHAMALDETRETFGIERCFGNRGKITEVWFRGGHGDIGGNATYLDKKEEKSNRDRSDIALNWMLSKAHACKVPVPSKIDSGIVDKKGTEAPVTTRQELISIGKVGTLSRRIHIGDLVHHSVERTELTRGINGNQLRRIDVPTRIEDADLEKQGEALIWIPPQTTVAEADNTTFVSAKPAVVELSSRRYPFDVSPARTWNSWFKRWEIKFETNVDKSETDIDKSEIDQFKIKIDKERLEEYWAPCKADRALAWDLYIELQTRITTQTLGDKEGNDKTALTSVYKLFELSRTYMHQHGVECANTATLLTAFLNQKIRRFTAKWHKISEDQNWQSNPSTVHDDFRKELKDLQKTLKELAAALSQVAGAQL